MWGAPGIVQKKRAGASGSSDRRLSKRRSNVRHQMKFRAGALKELPERKQMDSLKNLRKKVKVRDIPQILRNGKL